MMLSIIAFVILTGLFVCSAGLNKKFKYSVVVCALLHFSSGVWFYSNVASSLPWIVWFIFAFFSTSLILFTLGTMVSSGQCSEAERRRETEQEQIAE